MNKWTSPEWREWRNARFRDRYASDPEFRAKVLEYRVHKKREYRAEGRGYFQYIKTQYGISQEEYMALWNGQNELCGICDIQMRETFKGITKRTKGHSIQLDTAVIDHCHKTGEIRGLLCNKCNRWIAQIEHRPEKLHRVAQWLKMEIPK